MLRLRLLSCLSVLLAGCPATPPPVLVTTPADKVFASSPHREADDAYVALSLRVSDANERSVVRGRPMLVTVTAGRGGSQKQPLQLKAEDLDLEAFRVGSDTREQWPFELLTPRSALDTTVDRTNPFAVVQWILPGPATLAIPEGRYRLVARWGGAKESNTFDVVNTLPVGADDLESRLIAALDTGMAAKARGDFVDMERAADSLLPELPDDPALLCLKAEALELKGDLRGALSAVNRALKASTPPPGVRAPEEPDPYSRKVQTRIFGKVRRMARDGGGP